MRAPHCVQTAMVLAACCCCSCCALVVVASARRCAEYYVDGGGAAASDDGPGNLALPWKTLAAVHRRRFEPGDVISLKSGTAYAGGLTLADAGTPGLPIRVTA